MRVLFATTNPAKIEYYAKELVSKGIEVLTIKDLDVKLEVDEDGKNAVENAIIKAKAYYDITKITTIAIDDSLYIEGLSEDKQPGTNVRRINGKRLDDNEMIEYYSNLVKTLGGKSNAKWIKGMAIYDGENLKTFEYARENLCFVDIPSKKINEGYPMDSLAIDTGTNKYLSELNSEELKKHKDSGNNQGIFKFMLENLIIKI